MGVLAERHRITCPYCVVGAGIVLVERHDQDLKFNMTEPVRCGSCRSFFTVRPHLKLVGVMLAEDKIQTYAPGVIGGTEDGG